MKRLFASRLSAKGVVGHLDEIRLHSVRGWAALKGMEQSLTVQLEIDGVIVSEAPANEYRGDLKGLISPSGCHGFSLDLPRVKLTKGSHSIAVLVKGYDVRLASKISTIDLPEIDLGLDAPKPNHVAPPITMSRDLIGEAPKIAMPALHKPVKMTVIMPTYNRGATMEATIRQFLPCMAKVGAELIVIDDGSKDDTRERLSKLASESSAIHYESIPNGGPGRARNKAAGLARGDLLMLVGDDVAPVDEDFLLYHETAHARFPARGQAVLGKITWPDTDQMDVNFVMRHIQGEGNQQFGYHYMTPYSHCNWNLFYSSNISIKKSIVENWDTQGFNSAFYLAAFEDAEFALRVSQQLESESEKFSILYLPTAKLEHYHKYDVESFIRRQVSVGLMAHEFLRLHPGREADLGLDELKRRLDAPAQQGADLPVEHYLAIFEGLRSWAVVIEKHHGLGSQNWHGDLLSSIFQLSYFEGYIRAQTTRINLANASRYMLENLRLSFNRAIMTEAIGHVSGLDFC